jgi:hypothetical protein
MSGDKTTEERTGFADTPSKEEWLGLLRNLTADLAAIELQIDQIKTRDLPTLETTAHNMRQRMAIIINRLDKR